MAETTRFAACDVCGAVAASLGELQRCGQCGWRCYCGPECQRNDWKEMGHKRVCKTIGAVREGKADVRALIEADRVEEVRALVLSCTIGVNDG